MTTTPPTQKNPSRRWNLPAIAGAGLAILAVSACSAVTTDSADGGPSGKSTSAASGRLTSTPGEPGPNTCTAENQAPDCLWPVPADMIHAGVPDGANPNAKFTSAQVNTIKQYAWGKWTARMKASAAEGVISAFFLFNEKAGGDGLAPWPANWHEPDFEITTGMRPPASTDMLGKWASTSKDGVKGSTKRYDRKYYIPKDGGPVKPMADLTKDQRQRMLSLNNFAFDDKGESQATNRQVSVDTGVNLGDDYHDYTFYYTPGGIWWEVDGKIIHGVQQPTEAIADKVDLGPQKFVEQTDMKAMAQGGGKINAYFNIWNGAFPDSQYWGGNKPPKAGADLDVAKLEYWKFTPEQCADKATCTAPGSFASTPELVSDFKNQTYTDGGQAVAFDEMWKVRDGYIKSLGSQFVPDGVTQPKSPGSPLRLSMQPRTDVRSLRLVNTNPVPVQVNYKSTGTARGNPGGAAEEWVELGTFPGGVGNTVVLPNDTTEISVTSGAPNNYAVCHITDVAALKAGGSYNLNPNAPWGPGVTCKTD